MAHKGKGAARAHVSGVDRSEVGAPRLAYCLPSSSYVSLPHWDVLTLRTKRRVVPKWLLELLFRGRTQVCEFVVTVVTLLPGRLEEAEGIMGWRYVFSPSWIFLFWTFHIRSGSVLGAAGVGAVLLLAAEWMHSASSVLPSMRSWAVSTFRALRVLLL